MQEKPLTQQVIVWDGDGETGRIFETAYTEAQIQAAILRCINHHGSFSSPRVVVAARRFEGKRR